MKVLIVTYYWPPAGGSGVQRWLKFVKYLQNFGIEPVVYTVDDANYPKNVIRIDAAQLVNQDAAIGRHAQYGEVGASNWLECTKLG